VWLPEAPWVRDRLAEVLRFPSGPYADRADCLSSAAI
jgi:phage terminase large subunit-like protein